MTKAGNDLTLADYSVLRALIRSEMEIAREMGCSDASGYLACTALADYRTAKELLTKLTGIIKDLEKSIQL